MTPKSLFEILPTMGWRRLERSDPRMLTDGSGNKFPTLERDGVRICLSTSRSLGVYHGYVTIYDSCDPSDIVIWQLVVDKTKRRQGRARTALRDLAKVAEQLSLRIYVEPVPTDDKSVGRPALVAFYRSEGFLPTEPGVDKVLVRQPGVIGQLKAAMAA